MYLSTRMYNSSEHEILWSPQLTKSAPNFNYLASVKEFERKDENDTKAVQRSAPKVLDSASGSPTPIFGWQPRVERLWVRILGLPFRLHRGRRALSFASAGYSSEATLSASIRQESFRRGVIRNLGAKFLGGQDFWCWPLYNTTISFDTR